MRFFQRHTRALTAALVALTAGIPSAVGAYRAYRDYTHRSHFPFQVEVVDGEERWHVAPGAPLEMPGEEGEAEVDDPRLRRIANRMIWGPEASEARLRKVEIARAEAAKWADLMPRAPSPLDFMRDSASPAPAIVGPGGAALSWVNLGPTDAAFEYNAGTYYQVDSGRGAGILVDPNDPQVVYFGTSGGGIWKTFNFGVANPTWHPVTETLGNIAVGAMDMDPNAPETLYVGLGDAFDQPGGMVAKTTTGGGSWSTPVALMGTYPPASGGFVAKAGTIRSVKVDPSNSNRVLVATDVGLFISTDAGATFSLVDLPNAGATQVAEATWSIAYAGVSGGNSRWVVSGVYACGAGEAPSDPGANVTAGSTNPVSGTVCTVGNLGDIWLSTDSGATWASRRASGGLPNLAVGRLNIAAGAPKANPATTVLYVQASAQSEYPSSAGAGLWRSTNGGTSFVDASGTLANPTNRVAGNRDCGAIDVNDAQAWYNSAIAVDPQNDANVMVGGMLCGLRTLTGTNATPSWENVAHWLPSGGGGNVTGGTLPYVHADWHRALIVRVGTTIRAIAGTDGGIFFSDNLFAAGVTPPSVVWGFPNRGIVSHLSYSVASGDPATGNPFVAFTGLQDNGTRIRDSSSTPTTFNQVIGGDGFGAGASSAGGTTVYWGSVYSSTHRWRCVPSGANRQCNQAGGAWGGVALAPLACGADAEPFRTDLAVVQAAPSPTFLTETDRGVYKSVGTGGWTALNPSCFVYGGTTHYARLGVAASEVIDGLYGVPLSASRFAVTSNCPGATTICTWTITPAQIGVDLNSNGTLEANERVSYTSSIAFPPGPTGRPVGDDFVVTSQSPGLMADLVTPLVPQVGLIFKTQDRGATWTPIHGNGTGYDLPLVAINVVRYDPSDTTNQTIYVGTDLGVYRTIDGGATWRRFGYGLPLVRVSAMYVGKAGQILRIGTYGRGVWEIYPSATAEHGVNGNGDFDRDEQIDFIDLAAMASRLGTDPTSAAMPYYDWNEDMVAPAPPNDFNAIDESDLSALLARFGGRP